MGLENMGGRGQIHRDDKDLQMILSGSQETRVWEGVQACLHTVSSRPALSSVSGSPGA